MYGHMYLLYGGTKKKRKKKRAYVNDEKPKLVLAKQRKH